jgi:hypothetical protein
MQDDDAARMLHLRATLATVIAHGNAATAAIYGLNEFLRCL